MSTSAFSLDLSKFGFGFMLGRSMIEAASLAKKNSG